MPSSFSAWSVLRARGSIPEESKVELEFDYRAGPLQGTGKGLVKGGSGTRKPGHMWGLAGLSFERVRWATTEKGPGLEPGSLGSDQLQEVGVGLPIHCDLEEFPFKSQVIHWQTQATLRQVLFSSCFLKCILVSC